MGSTLSPRRLGAGLLGAVLAGAVACASFQAEDASSPAAADDGGDASSESAADSQAPSCGGRDCLGGACVDGGCAPVTIAANQPTVSAIALDATNVYWVTETAAGGIYQCPLGGCAGAPVPLIAGRDRPHGLTIAGGNVYWTESGTKGITRCVPATCDATRNVVVTALDGSAGEIASDEVFVYATEGEQGQRVARCPLEGGGACATATNASGAPPRRITGAAGTAFFSSSTGEVRRWLGAPGISDILGGSSRIAGVQGVAATPDGGTVFFVNELNGTIARAPNLAGAGQTALDVLVVTAAPERVVFDGERLFWTDMGSHGNDGSIFTCQPDTCMASLRVVARVNNPGALAVDAVSVYFSSLGDADAGVAGAVLRVAKP